MGCPLKNVIVSASAAEAQVSSTIVIAERRSVPRVDLGRLYSITTPTTWYSGTAPTCNGTCASGVYA